MPAMHALEHRAVAELVEVGEDLLGLALHLVGERLDEVRAAERIGHVGHVRLVGDHLLGAQRDARRLLGRQRQRLVHRVGVQRCVPPSTPASASIAVRTMFTSGCCAVSDTPAVWVWNRSCIERSICGAVALLHPPRPDAPGGPVLGDLLEEVDVGVEEEAQPRRERVDRQARLQRQLDVGEAVGERERQLLGGRRAGLADVVAGDRDRVPPRHLGGGERDRVAHQPHRRPRREHELLLRLVLLQDVVLQRAAERARGRRRPSRPGRRTSRRSPRPAS